MEFFTDNDKKAIDIMDSAALQFDNIVDITDRSDEYMLRRRYIFNNGYEVSVIRGYGAYTQDNVLEFETAVFDDGEWATKDFYPNHYDDVCGSQSIEDVCLLFERIAEIK